jgi:hypothetical protein
VVVWLILSSLGSLWCRVREELVGSRTLVCWGLLLLLYPLLVPSGWELALLCLTLGSASLPAILAARWELDSCWTAVLLLPLGGLSGGKRFSSSSRGFMAACPGYCWPAIIPRPG